MDSARQPTADGDGEMGATLRNGRQRRVHVASRRGGASQLKLGNKLKLNPIKTRFSLILQANFQIIKNVDYCRKWYERNRNPNQKHQHLTTCVTIPYHTILPEWYGRTNPDQKTSIWQLASERYERNQKTAHLTLGKTKPLR